MPYPDKCPICRSLLAFPDTSAIAPVRCSVCNTRFKISGRITERIEFDDYYELLEVPSHAAYADIEKACRVKILEYHPDHNPDDPEAAQEKLRRVIEARDILTDRGKRTEYDFIFHARTLRRWKSSGRSVADKNNVPGNEKQKYEGIDHLKDEIEDMKSGKSGNGWSRVLSCLAKLRKKLRW